MPPIAFSESSGTTMKICFLLLLAGLLTGPDHKVALQVVEADGKRIIGRTYVAPTMGFELIKGEAVEHDVLYCRQLEIHRNGETFVGLNCDGGVYLELKAMYF